MIAKIYVPLCCLILKHIFFLIEILASAVGVGEAQLKIFMNKSFNFLFFVWIEQFLLPVKGL